jgi:hypothetical protein
MFLQSMDKRVVARVSPGRLPPPTVDRADFVIIGIDLSVWLSVVGMKSFLDLVPERYA